MKYDEAINALGALSADLLSAKLEKLKNREELSETEVNTLLEETVGLLFSASKECKEEELYRVLRSNNAALRSHSETLTEENPIFGEGYINLYGDPILPFVEGKIAEGETVSIMTYRKAVLENPLALLLSGFPENSTVFDILEKDGFTAEAKSNYLAICDFIKAELAKENRDEILIRKIKNLIEGEEPCKALCNASEGGTYIAMQKDLIDVYYICTSVIVCRLDWIENKGEIVEVTPISHSIGAVKPGEKIKYEEFGEVGAFTFEMTDYR